MSPADRTFGDDILRWVSENGSGRWTQLSEAIGSCTRAADRKVRSWVIASRLANLGHIDMDWDDGRWSVAPPCIAVSPGMGLCGYLAGWRTAALLERLSTATDELDVFLFDVKQDFAPTALFVKSSSTSTLHDLGERLQVPVVYDPATRLAALVQLSGERRQRGAAPPPDEPLKRFDPGSLTWTQVDSAEEPGLHSFELHGRMAFRLREADDWYIVDRAEGQLRELKGRDDVIRWHSATADGRGPCAMSVASEISLPALATRAAVAASGLLPLRRIGARVYPNVNRLSATHIAERLGLVLSLPPDKISMEG